MVWMLWNNINNWIWNKEKSAATQLGLQAFHVWKHTISKQPKRWWQ
jgi:hypothetical protein